MQKNMPKDLLNQEAPNLFRLMNEGESGVFLYPAILTKEVKRVTGKTLDSVRGVDMQKEILQDFISNSPKWVHELWYFLLINPILHNKSSIIHHHHPRKKRKPRSSSPLSSPPPPFECLSLLFSLAINSININAENGGSAGQANTKTRQSKIHGTAVTDDG